MADEPHANPSRDPANDGSMLGMAKQILDKHLQGIDDMLPARVVSYDRESNRAQVVPLVKVLTTDNRQIGRAAVASVPVYRPGGGDMVLSFNLRAGDLGWLKANDRDISIVLQSYAENAPNTMRKHSFQDAMFFPDAMRNVVIDPEDRENAVLQTIDGTVRIALWPDKIKLTSGALTITMGPSEIEIEGPVKFTGPVAFQGPLTTAAGATIDGIAFGSHKHTGVQTGGDVSGGPTS